MNKRVKILIQLGLVENYALILSWEHLSQDEKNCLSYEQCLVIWSYTDNSVAKKELWGLIITKQKTFKECQDLWYKMINDGPEKDELYHILQNEARSFNEFRWIWKITRGLKPEVLSTSWSNMKEKASSFEEYALMLQDTSDNSLEHKKLIKILRNKAETFDHYKYFWKKIDRKEKIKVWKVLKTKIESFEQCQWAWENTSLFSFENNEAWAILTSKIESFDQCKIIWANTTHDSPAQEQIIRLMLDKALTFEECHWVWQNIPLGKQYEIEAWELLKARISNFLECHVVWRESSVGTAQEIEVMELMLSKMKTFEQFMCIWEETITEIPQKVQVIRFLKVKIDKFFKNLDLTATAD